MYNYIDYHQATTTATAAAVAAAAAAAAAAALSRGCLSRKEVVLCDSFPSIFNNCLHNKFVQSISK